jgi:hypothetical protein
MSSSDVTLSILNVISLLMLLIFAYPAYWAFSIKRSLPVRIYKNQALGIGLASISLGVLSASAPIPIYFFPNNISIVDGVFYPLQLAGFLMLLYWVDSTILANRRSDPLLRDTLKWNKIRFLFWALAIYASITILAYLMYSEITQDSLYLNQLFSNIGSGTGSQNPILGISVALLYGPLFFIICLLYIPAMAIRSRRNLSVIRYLKWASVAIVVFFVIAVFFEPPGPIPFTYSDDIVLLVMYPLVSFLLYKSVRSLIPVSRISRSGIET